MGEGGSSSVGALVIYDPSITSPKAIAGEWEALEFLVHECVEIWQRAAGGMDCPVVWNLEIPAYCNSWLAKRELSDIRPFGKTGRNLLCGLFKFWESIAPKASNTCDLSKLPSSLLKEYRVSTHCRRSQLELMWKQQQSTKYIDCWPCYAELDPTECEVNTQGSVLAMLAWPVAPRTFYWLVFQTTLYLCGDIGDKSDICFLVLLKKVSHGATNDSSLGPRLNLPTWSCTSSSLQNFVQDRIQIKCMTWLMIKILGRICVGNVACVCKWGHQDV